ncbi:methyltransferase domain-containing protein, partial [Streptomyces sp. NPDC026294]|uniref:class I SAM-dependent methyltransferase n=1 Tax=Streptomyces sp. NPDC026294 TaxID=3155362 RepID=UPI00340B8FE2
MTQIADPQSFDRFALDYDRFVSLLPGQNTAWLLGLDLKGKRALDAGCGAGHAVEALADNFEEVVGLDLSAPLIEIARAKRARPNVRYAVEDLFGLKAEDDFDLVYSHTMLHHLEDYRAGLEHLKSLVRPGGTITLMLHGLRNQVGDSTFRRIEQSFFDRYRDKAT